MEPLITLITLIYIKCAAQSYLNLTFLLTFDLYSLMNPHLGNYSLNESMMGIFYR